MIESLSRVCFTNRFLFPCLLTLLAAGCAKMLAIPTEVQPGQAAAIIKANRANPDFILLDVRTPKEYVEGHIPGSLNIDFNASSFRPEIDKLDRKKTYLLYCRSGSRSGKALEVMKEMGFSHVAHIAGGIVAWRQAGQRVIVGPDRGIR